MSRQNDLLDPYTQLTLMSNLATFKTSLLVSDCPISGAISNIMTILQNVVNERDMWWRVSAKIPLHNGSIVVRLVWDLSLGDYDYHWDTILRDGLDECINIFEHFIDAYALQTRLSASIARECLIRPVRATLCNVSLLIMKKEKEIAWLSTQLHESRLDFNRIRKAKEKKILAAFFLLLPFFLFPQIPRNNTIIEINNTSPQR